MSLKKDAFTLIEMMVSIVILSIMMTFLYQSYASLNLSNDVLKKEVQGISNIQNIKKVIYLDFALALHNSTKIQNREKNEDAVFLQSSNSVHKRFNPYIVYMVKENKLYRLESLKKIESYELASDAEFDVDYLGEVKSFRVYKSSKAEKEIYLVHVDLKDLDEMIMKIKVLNEY